MNLSPGARLLFIGLITQADDAGRGNADARSLRAAIFPGDELPIADVEVFLQELADQGLAQLYAAETGAKLYCLPTWKRHQRIDKPQPARYPAPDGTEPFPEHSKNAPVLFSEGSRLKGEEGMGEERTGGSARARPELTPERAAMAAKLAPGADAGREWDAFLDHVASTGRELADVDAGWRSWLRKVATFGAVGQKRNGNVRATNTAPTWDEALAEGDELGVLHDGGPETLPNYLKRIAERKRATQQSPAA